MATIADFLGGGLPAGLLSPEQMTAAEQRAQNASLLNLGFALLQGSRGQPGQGRPGLAQIIGQAGPVALQAYQQSFDRTLTDALRGMQIAEMRRKQQEQESARQARERFTQRMSELQGGVVTPQMALAGGAGPTQAAADTIGQAMPAADLTRQQQSAALEYLAQTAPEEVAKLAFREPKREESFRLLTPEEKRNQGLPQDINFQISSSGKISQIGQGPLVKNIVGGEVSPFSKEAQQLQAREFADIRKSGATAQRTLQDVNKLSTLLEKSGTGFLPAVKQIAGEYGIETKGLGDIQAAQAIINRLVPQQRPPGSGTMSDADLALFKQSLPRIINQPGGNKIIVNTLKNINNYLVEEGKIAADVLNGKISPEEGYGRMSRLANPLEAFKPSSEGTLQDRINAELKRRQGQR